LDGDSANGVSVPEYLKPFMRGYLYEQILLLSLQGYTVREIAKIIYGTDSYEARNRVKVALWKARRRSFLPFLEQAHESFRLLEREGAVKGKEHARSRYQRQWLEHQNMLFYILLRLGVKPNDPLAAEVNWLHAKLFAVAWREWADRLKVWRNGTRSGGKPPFSFTWHSLAYVYTLIDSVLMRKGLFHKRGELDAVVRTLIPRGKLSRMEAFYRAYVEVSSRLHPFLFPPHL
jgi:hypothetical protein